MAALLGSVLRARRHRVLPARVSICSLPSENVRNLTDLANVLRAGRHRPDVAITTAVRRHPPRHQIRHLADLLSAGDSEGLHMVDDVHMERALLLSDGLSPSVRAVVGQRASEAPDVVGLITTADPSDAVELALGIVLASDADAGAEHTASPRIAVLIDDDSGQAWSERQLLRRA